MAKGLVFYDPLVHCKGKVLYSIPEALMCKKDLEEVTKKPWYFRDPAGFNIEENEYEIVVQEGLLPGCKDGAVFDTLFGSNEALAKQCADSLTMMTGRPHSANMFQRGRFWGVDWKVVELKPTKK